MRRTTTVRRSAVLGTVTLIASLLASPATAQEQRHTLLCPERPPVAGFDDRDEVSPVHRTPVDCLAFLEVAEGRGYDEGVRYLPRADVRRDQMASFIVRALEASGAVLPPAEDQGFEDIAGSPHEANIQRLAAAGITEGKSSSRYAPGESVDRDQMASFLLRAVAWYQGTSESAIDGGPTRFDDVVDANVHAEAIAGTYQLGIAAGVTSQRYEPDREVSRQQMASFLVRTLAVANQDPQVCSNHRDGYTLTMPAGWVTNPGDVEPRCTVFDTSRFVLEPGTELPADAAAVVRTEPIGYTEAADGAEHRDELGRRSDSARGHDAIVVESEATGEGLYPEGTRIYTWYVDATVGDDERTLIGTTTDLADDYVDHADGLDQMMDTLVLGVPRRTTVADHTDGARPFHVAAWVAGQPGLCTQAVADDAVGTTCAALEGLDELEVRLNDLGDWGVLSGSVDDTIDTVEVESRGGDVEEPTLVQVWGRQVFAASIAYEDVDVVRAIRDGSVVASADLPD